MTIFVNDKPQQCTSNTTLAQLLQQLGINTITGIAVAINSEVVPRSEWVTQTLQTNDRILVITATQGG